MKSSLSTVISAHLVFLPFSFPGLPLVNPTPAKLPHRYGRITESCRFSR